MTTDALPVPRDELTAYTDDAGRRIFVGALAFNARDEPVRVESLCRLPSGNVVAEIEYLGHDRAVDVSFAGDLSSETHDEFRARSQRADWHPGDWPPFRTPAELPDAVGWHWPTWGAR
jgi:hypothetical protein